VPDLIAFGANGVAIAVEVKTPTGRVSKFQTRVIEQLKAVGAHAHVVRSVEEIEQIIENIK
jgi:hypothetical protein